ncbi:hypothetical protein ADUPG1_009511, partial [Aduncisulcus paluster]
PLFDSDNNYDVTVQGMFPASLTTLSVAGRTSVTFPAFFTSLALSDGSALPALTTLDLSGTNVIDLSPLPATVTSLNLTQRLIDDDYLSTLPIRDLSSIPSTVTELIVGSMFSINLDFIDYLPNLVHLEISNCNILDLSKLSQVKDTLEYLSFHDVFVLCDFSVLAELKTLKYLELSEIESYSILIPDLSPLSNLTHFVLSNIDYEVEAIIDVSWLSSLTNLEYLELEVDEVLNFDETSLELENLKVMKLHQYGYSFDSFSFLSRASNLVSLSIGSASEFCVNIPDMSDLPNLIELELQCYSFDDSILLNISQLTNLESLTLIFEYSSYPLSSLSSLSSLKNLTVEGSMVVTNEGDLTSISLPSLPSLEYLNFGDINSTDSTIPDLSDFLKLRTFQWSNGNHSDFSNLSSAPTLQAIFSSFIMTQSELGNFLPQLLEITLDANYLTQPMDLSEAIQLKYLEFNARNIDISGSVLPTNIRLLKISNMASGDEPDIDLSSLTQLQSIDLASNYAVDMSFLSSVSSSFMRHLDLWYCLSDDISFLSSMTSLEILNIDSNSIVDISLLSQLTSLKVLKMYSNVIVDLSPLSTLISLEYLAIGNNSISNLSPLASLLSLESLTLNNNDIVDVSPISNLSSLVYLDLYSNNISDMSPIMNLESLSYLDCSQNNISDSSFLVELSELMFLDVSENSISSFDGEISFPNMRMFYAYSNSLSDVSFLTSMQNVIEIYFDENMIDDGSYFSDLTEVIAISISSNMITDISPFLGLPYLGYLGIAENYLCYGNEDEDAFYALFDSENIELEISDQTCHCPSLDPDSESTIASISEGLVCSETAPSSETWAVTCMSDSYYTYSDSDTFTCTRSADCSGGCGYGSECRANSDGTHSCASVVPDVALHGCVSDMIDAADKVAVGDGTYEFGVASLKNISASTSLTCPSSSVSSLAGLEHIGSMTAIDVSSNSIVDISPIILSSTLTSIDVHSNQISDVSVLINENGSTTPLPSDVLLSLNISDNLICDIADVNSELTSYFTNSSFSLESSESDQTCMCSPEPDFSENEICFGVTGFDDLWSMNCWNGYYYDEGLASCVEATSASDIEICDECELNDRMISVLKEGASTITCECVDGLTGDDCSIQDKPIEIPDENLKNAICTQLGYSSGCSISSGDLLQLTTLSVSNVDSFEGLLSATNLLSLSVDGTATSGLEIGNTSMSDLPTSLKLLSLANISLASDLNLSFLTNLEELLLDSDGNLIIGPVFIEDLPTSLQSISISSISITSDIDFSSLESLKELTLDSIDRVLTNAMISTLPASLTSVSILDSVFEFPIDFSGLKSLVSLTLNKNEISDLGGFVSSLPPSLSSLDLSANSISDPTPLYSVSFTSLVSLDLGDNLICGMDADGIGDVKTHLSLDSFSASANTCNCSALTSSFSFESGIVCKESWSDHWEPTCCSSCYHDISVSIGSNNSACVLIDRTESPEMYEKCHDLSSDNMMCAADGADGTEVSVDTISIMCIDGWYGKECTSEFGCNTSTHQCTCTDSYVGDLCTIAPNVTLGTLNMDAVLKHSICTSLGFSSTNCDDSSFVDDIGIEEVETITIFTVANTVISIEGMQYMDNLSYLSFAAGNTSISDITPLAELSKLASVTISEMEKMNYDMLDELVTSISNSASSYSSSSYSSSSTHRSRVSLYLPALSEQSHPSTSLMSSSSCVGWCSLDSLNINGCSGLTDTSQEHTFSDSISLLNGLAVCVGDCEIVDGVVEQPLASSLSTLVLSNNNIMDPSIIAQQPSFSSLTTLDLSQNSISDIALVEDVIESIGSLDTLDVSANTIASCSDSVVDDSSSNPCSTISTESSVLIFSNQTADATCGDTGSSCDYANNFVCGVNSSGETACVCATGFYLDTASNVCVAAADGACDSCGGERGECVYSTDLSTAICECFDGWFGDECSRQCPTDSDGNVCSTNGTCSSVFNTCSCSDDTFFGSACQLVCVADDNCSGNGTCVFAIENDSELVTCQCYDGFGGDSCETILSTSSLETWQLVLIICGGVAVVCVAIVIIVKCCCCSKKLTPGVQSSAPTMQPMYDSKVSLDSTVLNEDSNQCRIV